MIANHPATLAARRIFGWWSVGPLFVTLVVIGEIASHLSPPAADIALWCFGGAAALLLARLGTWVLAVYPSFDRHERAGAVVMFFAIVLGWNGTRVWLFEKQFDYLVASGNTSLKLSLSELSGKILVFVADRTRHAPPAPKPATWEQDEDAVIRYQNETVLAFEDSFGRAVRSAHDTLRLYGLTDRDFEEFYQRPSDPFEMRVIAVKLATFAGKIPTT